MTEFIIANMAPIIFISMIFFLLVSVVAFFQLRVTRRQEVEQ